MTRHEPTSGGDRRRRLSGLRAPAEQLSLLDATPATARTSGAIDEIRERFGASAIGPAGSIGSRGPRSVRRGAQQWRPDQAPPDDRRP